MATKSKLTFRKQAAMNQIVGKLARGVDRGLDFITDGAISRAPVRKVKASRTGEPITAFRERQNEGQLSPRSRQKMIKKANESAIIYNLTRPRGAPERKAITGLSSSIRSRRRQENLAYRSGRPQPGMDSGSNRAGSEAFTIRFQTASGDQVSPLGVGFRKGRLRRTAVRGGFLKGNIKRTGVSIEGNKVRGSVKSGAPYSKYVEFGTGRSKAQPYMRPAIEDWKVRWRDDFKG